MISAKGLLNLKTRARLALALIFMGILPAVVIGLLAYDNASKTIQDEVRSKLNSAADLKSAEISGWINTVISDIHLLAVNFLDEEHITVILDPNADPDLQSAFGNFLTENLLSLQQSRQGYAEIYYVDQRGNILLSTDASRVRQNAFSADVVKGTFAAGAGPYVQDAYLNGEKTEMAFGHVLREVDLVNLKTTDTINAAVIIRVDLEKSLYPIVQAWPARGETGEMLLIDNGSQQFISPLRFLENGVLDPDLPVNFSAHTIEDLNVNNPAEIREFQDYRGIITLSALRVIPETNWVFLAKLDRAEAFSSVDHLATLSFFATLIVLIAGTILATFIARGLTAPLELLTQAAREVEAGNFKTTVNMNRNDEFGELSLAFNRMVKAVQENADELQALVKFSGSLLRSSDIEDTLKKGLGEVLWASQAKVGAVLLNANDSDETVIKAAFGTPRGWLGRSLRMDSTNIAGRSMALRKPVTTSNELGEGELQELGFFEDLQISTAMSVPMLIDERPIGAFVVGTNARPRFSSREINLVQTIANQTAIALQRTRLITRLSSSYDQTLQSLAAALDARDKETEGHSQRVVAYTTALVNKLDINQPNIQEIRRGALLHDIGKIGVPDFILNKPGPLNEEEWPIMRRHPQWGEQIIAGIPFLKIPAEIVRAHHEQWDGHGYPDGLRGREIPIGARIFSVVDAFDAITSDRPYRSARSFSTAREEILAGRGTQFDPEVVDAFLQLTEEDWMLLREQANANS